METKYSVELTPMDRDIINSYRQMLAGLSDYLGSAVCSGKNLCTEGR